MAGNVDNQIRIEEARQLKIDIENEFAQVDQLLNQVADCCSADPAEDDTIMQKIDEVGKFMDEKYKEMKKAFDKAMDALGDIINEMGKWIQKRMEELEEYKSKIK